MNKIISIDDKTRIEFESGVVVTLSHQATVKLIEDLMESLGFFKYIQEHREEIRRDLKADKEKSEWNKESI